jgi:hypothetical protein
MQIRIRFSINGFNHVTTNLGSPIGTVSLHPFVKEPTEFADRLTFDLADSLAGHLEDVPDLAVSMSF